jgi:outer membrane protein assembly factor BamE
MVHHIVTPIVMPVNLRSPILAGLIVAACTLLAACSSTNKATSSSITSGFNPVNWMTPYKADVVQGNFISSEQVAQLQSGMSRSEVRNLLGTPLLASIFHANRWDYVFTLQRQGLAAQSFNYSVFFKGDLLDTFTGDAMPSETEFIAKMDQRRKLGKVPPLEATPAQLEAAAKKMPPKASTQSTDGATTQPTVASYPPLESPRQ